MLSGYCDDTGWENDGGNCDTGTKGFWNLKYTDIENWDKAFKTCLKLCSLCNQCNYISFSIIHKDCSWFKSCDTIHNTVHGFRTFNTTNFTKITSNMSHMKPLIFVKTHKTGGTTVANILLRIGITLGLSCVPPINGDSGLGCPHKLFPNVNIMKSAKLFAQHVTYDPKLLSMTSNPPLLITIFRNPVSQAISAFRYSRWQHILNRFGNTDWNDHINRLNRSDIHNTSCYYMNSQSHDLGFSNNLKCSPFEWVQKIIRSFDLIMITEYFKESLILCKTLLNNAGWNVKFKDLAYLVQNKENNIISKYAYKQMSDSLKYSKSINIDLLLYEKAHNKFRNLWNRDKARNEKQLKKVLICENTECRQDNIELMRLCSY